MGSKLGCHWFCVVSFVGFGFQYRIKRLAGKNVSEWPTLSRGRVGRKTVLHPSIHPLASPGKYDWTIARRRCGFMSNYFDHLFSYRHVLSFFPIFCEVLYDRLNRLACQLLGIGDSRYRLDAFGNCLLTATIRKLSRLMELRLPDFPRKSTGYFCPSLRSICLYTAQCHTGVKVGRH